MFDHVNAEIPSPRKSESDSENAIEPLGPIVEVVTNEENEIELCKIRARLYRFDIEQREWKERGTGIIKLLHHPENGTVRVVMRRDKTFKLCANHFVTDDTQLNPHMGSDRAFNWTTLGDFADETTKQEFLAIKFGNTENAKIWKTTFNDAIKIVKTKNNTSKSLNESLSDNFPTESSDSQSDEKTLDTSDEKSDEKENVDEGVVLQLSELKLEKGNVAAE